MSFTGRVLKNELSELKGRGDRGEGGLEDGERRDSCAERNISVMSLQRRLQRTFPLGYKS